MEKQNFMQIASSFYDAVQDQDNASKPNSKDLSFVAMCMNPTRTRAEVDFLYSDVERRLEIIKSIHDYISSTGSELATEIWKSVQIASFWAFLFTISVQQLVDIEIFLRNNSSPDRVSLEMRLFLLQTEVSQIERMLDNFFASSCRKKQVPPDMIIKRDQNLAKQSLSIIWGDRLKNLQSLVCRGDGCIIESLQNVICLSHDLHKMWSKGHFAFYPEPAQPEGDGWSMRLRFCWMENVRFDPSQHITEHFLSTPRTVINAQPLTIRGALAAVQLVKSTPIFDGKIVNIRAARKEDLPSYDICLLQYDIIRMAALCGGGNVHEERLDDDEGSVPDSGMSLSPLTAEQRRATHRPRYWNSSAGTSNNGEALATVKFAPQPRINALPLSTPVGGAPHRQIHPVGPRRHGRAAAERHAAPRGEHDAADGGRVGAVFARVGAVRAGLARRQGQRPDDPRAAWRTRAACSGSRTTGTRASQRPL
ncbi:uncharacterized protein VDAG_01789 [Verticillium dahliae VdLs.17]|uniref:HNH nuclease domain-containing protein n=1 Tax=Verticillium dahliae (strain VdLs.17 / ATCC MYA-4575 / FGSC 10137) TaxID=498257 RepID=G2WW03_VERDV|nr:uncharacterized protein VDAG_01789 [Verticillium dahliae VdLs.17]EGY19773.1 hypothetical protein VDAG_01789 [Verticillium dahliae VdLs.17]